MRYVLGIAFLAALALAALAALNSGPTDAGMEPQLVRFVHYPRGAAPEHAAGPHFEGSSASLAVCSDPATNGTDQCDSYLAPGLRWPADSLPVHYSVNVSRSGDDGGFGAAIQASAQTWNDEGRTFQLEFDGLTGRKNSSLSNRMDGHNDVTWDNLALRYPGAIAVTFVWYLDSDILEADMSLNTWYAWSSNAACDAGCDPDAETGDPLAFDVQDIGAHEFGHFLLLDDLYDASDSALTMYGYAEQGELKKRTLGLGDELGIANIYPVGSEPTPPPTPSPTPPPGDNSVAEIELKLLVKGSNYQTIASVKVLDSSTGDIVKEAPVAGSWTLGGEFLNDSSNSTNGRGVARLESDKTPASPDDVFTITISEPASGVQSCSIIVGAATATSCQ